MTRLQPSMNSDMKNEAVPAAVVPEWPIEGFVAKLRSIPESTFSGTQHILEFLAQHPVNAATLKPYLFWDRQHYTRNLIDKTPLYELIAVCWESGQMSSVHNHQDQNCWMAVPMGRLMVQNYRVMHQDLNAGTCRIEKTSRVEMSVQHPQVVDPEAPVHCVLNPRQFKQRAVSLHVYSRPYDTCLVYSEEKQTCGKIGLSYTSVAGSLR